MASYNLEVTIEATDEGFLLKCKVDGEVHSTHLFDTYEEAKRGANDLMDMIASVTKVMGGTVHTDERGNTN